MCCRFCLLFSPLPLFSLFYLPYSSSPVFFLLGGGDGGGDWRLIPSQTQQSQSEAGRRRIQCRCLLLLFLLSRWRFDSSSSVVGVEGGERRKKAVSLVVLDGMPQRGSRGKGEGGLHGWRVQPLTPLVEGPEAEGVGRAAKKESSWELIRSWVRRNRDDAAAAAGGGHSAADTGGKRSDLRLALGILGCPLAPVSGSLAAAAVDDDGGKLQRLSLKDAPIEKSSAHYIIQQYLAATGCLKQQICIKNMYTTGSVRVTCWGTEIGSGKTAAGVKGPAENGRFLLWQMSPGMWSMELAVAGCKIVAGSNGKVVWRHMPWLGLHAAKGPQRPLRRIIQGLDPRLTASMFSQAQCLGEKCIGDEDCFVLKVSADHATIAERSEGPAEVIRHVLYGYFSQKTGLLVYMEDSHLTRVQAPASDAVYWETTIGSTIEDYQEVDGVLIAHAGQSVATVFRFSEGASHQSRTRMEEEWCIEDVVFNVAGLSVDCFIPPAEISNATERL